MRSVLVSVFLLGITVLLLGCTSYGNSNAQNTAVPVATTPGQSEMVSITIQSFAFSPSTVTISKGTTVKWVNKDSVSHNIKFDAETSPSFGSGETFSKTFDTPGTYNYICGIHPNMKGQIIVQ